MDNYKEILSVIGTIVLVIAVFYGAYVVSRFVGKNYNPHNGSSKNIKILESMSVGKDKTLMVIQVADKVMLVGSTVKGFDLLADLDPDKLSSDPNIITKQPDFISTLKIALSTRNKHGKGEDN